jgi:hypothetical protein
VRPQFESAQQALTLYFRALSGRGCELSPYADDADLWQHPDTATTVRLPATAPPVDRWYDVALTHRALHHAMGTFELDFDRPEPLFRRIRPAALALPALEQFTRLFGRSALAVEVYAVLEDLRIDAAAVRRFPGLAPAFRAVQREALENRPELVLLPPRAAVAEALVRLSLGARDVMAPSSLFEPLSRVAAVARALTAPVATALSSVEAAIRIYQVLAGLPNVGVQRSARPFVFASSEFDRDDAWFRLGEKEIRLEGDEKFDVRFPPVRYRDVPGPRYAGQQASGMPLQEAILRMTPDEAADSSDEDTEGLVERSLQAERGGVDVTATDRPDTPPEPLPHDHGPDLDDDHDHVHGHLHAGVTRALKERNPSIKCFAVRPDRPDHPIQGGGFGRPNLTHLHEVALDGYVEISGAEAKATARRLATREGIFAGYSSGANVAAALHLLRTELPGATIAVVIPDSGLKYLSTDLW